MPTSRLVSFFQNPRTTWPWSGPNLNIGLDMDSQAITFVEFGKRKGRPYLKQWGFEFLESNIIQDGRIKNKVALVSVLTAFVEKYKLRGACVAMGVNGASVMVKRISVSKGHQGDLDDYVMWEGPHYIPYDSEEVYLDYSRCASPAIGETAGDVDLLLVAAKREAVDERREVLEAAQLRPVICDVEGLAFLNWASLNDVVQHHKTSLFANLREEMMNVAVMVQGEPLLVRDVNFSSGVNQDLANKVSTDTRRVLGRNFEAPAFDNNPSPSEKTLWLEIQSELKRTIEGAREILPDLDIEKVFLGGRLAQSFGLQEELRQHVSIPVCPLGTVPMELSRAKGRSQSLPPFAHIAEGLALRALHG